MHGVTGSHVHVFPHRDDRTKPMTDATRTTGSTRLIEMGFSSDWIERQLAHMEPNAVRRTYNHADYFADRAKMMQHWADILDAWKTGANALSLRMTSEA